MLATKSRVPSGESAIGRTGPLSKVNVGETLGAGAGGGVGEELWQAATANERRAALASDEQRDSRIEKPICMLHSYPTPGTNGLAKHALG